MKFRVITYNIHKGVGGVDRRYRIERVIETLAHYAPDIVFMQEVADGVPRSRRHRQVDVIGDALELRHRAFQHNVSLAVGHYGNAILSRFPMSDVQDIELSIPLKKRRQALAAHCLIRQEHQRTVLLMNTHLGLAGFERSMQVRRMLAADVLVHCQRSTPVIMGGDYNDVWGTLGKRLMEPQGFRAASGRARTFPAIMPMQTLDHIYYRGELDLHHSFPCRRQVARLASDHLPLIADFELKV